MPTQHPPDVLLHWKPRFPQYKRRKVLALVQEMYPTATDTGPALRIPVKENDTKPIWLFLFWNCWSEIGEKEEA